MINVQKCPAQNLSALSVGKTCIFIHNYRTGLSQSKASYSTLYNVFGRSNKTCTDAAVENYFVLSEDPPISYFEVLAFREHTHLS
jgi:hypothetical protein